MSLSSNVRTLPLSSSLTVPVANEGDTNNRRYGTVSLNSNSESSIVGWYDRCIHAEIALDF